MTEKALSVFRILSWNENPIEGPDGGQKCSRAEVEKSYAGELTGKGTVEYVMAYVSENDAAFVGVEYFEGTLKNRAGSFMLEHGGTYAAGVVTSKLRVIPGSGRGELEGLTGSVDFTAGHQEEYEIEFEYGFGETTGKAEA